jgi:predicted small secreted protein
MLQGTRRFVATATAVMAVGLMLAACGDTWKGAKKDTRDNVKATGEGVEGAGKAIKKSVE